MESDPKYVSHGLGRLPRATRMGTLRLPMLPMRLRSQVIAVLSIAGAVAMDVVGGACLPVLARDPRVTPGVSASAVGTVPILYRSDLAGSAAFPNVLAAR